MAAPNRCAMLPRHIREFVAQLTVEAYDTVKLAIREDSNDITPALGTLGRSFAGTVLDHVRSSIRADFERLVLFTILFRSQADQSRRLDSVDATLGVVLTALLVLAPLAVEHAPTTPERWAVLLGFVVLVGMIGRALFFISAPEPKPTILAAKLLGDLKAPHHGSLDEVRAAIHRVVSDPIHPLTKDEMIRRGASGDLAVAIAADRQRLRRKRFHLGLALILFLVLALIVGWRDVVSSFQEEPARHAATGIPD